MDKDKQWAKESFKNMTFTEKIKHLWYYYKVHTIITVILLASIIGTIISIATRERYDLEVVYFGSRTFDVERIDFLEEQLEASIVDVNGDGEVNVNVIVNTADTSEESQFLAAMVQKMNVDLAAATYHSYIVDEYFMEILNQNDVLEAYFDTANSPVLNQVLALDPRMPKEYWCTRALYEYEKTGNNEENINVHVNAQMAHRFIESATSFK